ncbi:hypothetical protein [Porphyromonas vaginalis]|uniref:hypothetical protein n=1 Tax=Porphyromonas vaginalis TaxID=3044325 RepID=UPI0026330DE8|nr:hypothetical protein [Porphyromonas vaginalis]
MWPFDYFKKKREKEEQERRRAEEQARQQKLEEERIARERERRLEENRRKELERQAKLKAEREQKESIQPFTFRSNCHQRYENDNPVMGLQECIRTVSLVKNTDGCPGYKLEPGVGYIVKIYNDDLGKPNMSDKPMKVVTKSADMVELRGFPIEARSPFGWQEVDYSDYGFVVYYKNGQVEKCVLHMYDRNIRLEYMTKSESASTTKTNSSIANASESYKLTETETLVKEALSNLRAGRDGDDTYHPLFKAWRSFQRDPEQLQRIQDEGSFGMAFMIFLSFGTVSDIDDKQQLASIAYLFLSKAIEKNSNDVNLYKNRILLMMLNNEAFGYTVSSAINPGGGFDIFSMNLHPFESRDAMYKMEYADLMKSPQLLSVDILSQRYSDLKYKIANGFFGQNQTSQTIIEKGRELHKKVLDYISKKVLTEEDIDF